MANIEQLATIAEMCDEYDYEDNLFSMDVSEISCLSCKKWDGRKCSIEIFYKLTDKLDELQSKSKLMY
jgi:predicted kinase